MTIPAAIGIGSHTFTVRTDDDTVANLRTDGNRADCQPDRLLIQIDPDLPKSLLAETLLHEVLHGCWHQTSLRVDERVSECEEDIVTALAPLLLGAIRSSAEFQALLVGAKK